MCSASNFIISGRSVIFDVICAVFLFFLIVFFVNVDVICRVVAFRPVNCWDVFQNLLKTLLKVYLLVRLMSDH